MGGALGVCALFAGGRGWGRALGTRWLLIGGELGTLVAHWSPTGGQGEGTRRRWQ